MTMLKTSSRVFIGWFAAGSVGLVGITLLKSNGIYLGTTGALLLGFVMSVFGIEAGRYWGSKA